MLTRLLRSIKVVATDVDGTLTDSQGINIKALQAVRELEKNGIEVFLVSSHAFIVTVSLAKYIGLKGLVIGESGAVIGRPWEILHQEKVNYDRWEIINYLLNIGFRDNINRFRIVDCGFLYSEKVKHLKAEDVKKLLKEKGFDVEVYFTKVSLHVLPKGVSKASGLLKALEIRGYIIDDVVFIGDADNDLPLFEITKISVAPSNATKLVKEKAKIILDKPNGEAFYELAKIILKAKNFS